MPRTARPTAQTDTALTADRPPAEPARRPRPRPGGRPEPAPRDDRHAGHAPAASGRHHPPEP
jgi:hypothetical protein